MTADDGEHPLGHLPLEIVVCVGKVKTRLADLLKLSQDTTFVLDRNVDDPVDLFVGGQLVARGVLEEREEEEGLSVRITERIRSTGARGPE